MRPLLRLMRNTGWKLFGEFSSRLVGLVLLMVLARRLAAEGFGQYAFAMAFSSLFVVLADLGLNTWLIKTIAQDPPQASTLLRPVARFKFLAGCVTLAVSVVVGTQISANPQVWLHIAWASLIWLAMSWLDTLGAFYNGLEQFGTEARLKIWQRLVGTSAALALLAWWPRLDLILAGSALGHIGIALWGTWILWHQLQPHSHHHISFYPLLQVSGPYWLCNLFATLYFRSDTVLLTLFQRPDFEIGWYQGAYKLFEILIVLPHLMLQGGFPLLADLAKHESDSFNTVLPQALKYLSWLVWPLLLGGMVLAEPLMVNLLGTAFFAATGAWNILLWALPLVYFNYLSFYVLTAHNRIHISVRHTALALGINLSANLSLIPSWGFLGCALSTLLTELGLALLNLQALRQLSVFPWPTGIGAGLIAALLMAGQLWLLTQLSVPWGWVLGLGLLSYPCWLWLTGAVTLEQKIWIRAFWQHFSTRLQQK